MNEWQPIETVPKDWKHYLFWLPKAEHSIGLSLPNGEVSLIGYLGDEKPTKWQHLPKPPESENAKRNY